MNDPMQNRQIIAFWESPVLEGLLVPCVQEIYDQKLLAPTDVVARPGYPLVKEFLSANPPAYKQLSASDEKEMELMQKLHLMSAGEKRKAMLKLGLVPDEKKQHPWEKALIGAGMLSPGKKWWTTSEGFSFRQFLALNG